MVVNSLAGLHNWTIIKDFASLYPSIMRAYNVGHSTIFKSKEEALKNGYLEDEIEAIFEFQKDKPTAYFVKHDVCKSLVSEAVAKLIKERYNVKKLMSKATGAKKADYDAKQKALKIIANSVYGSLGTLFYNYNYNNL